MQVREGTIVVYADIACPWASLAVERFHRIRSELGFEGHLVLDLRAFPLELFNERPTPKHILDKEIAAISRLEPEIGWKGWTQADAKYPGTVLLSLEAVQAAKRQSLKASEALDLALRRAFLVDSRSIYLRSEILAIAGECEEIDADILMKLLDEGTARQEIIDQKNQGESDEVEGSPHFFLPDGTDIHNPGIEMHWDEDTRQPVIDANEPEAIKDMIERAAGAARKGG